MEPETNAGNEGRLLFVHRDISNIALKDNQQAASINSFVQRRRIERSKHLQGSEEKDSGLHNTASSFSASNFANSKHRWRIGSGPTVSRGKGRIESPHDAWQGQAQVGDLYIPNPATILKKGNSDPFDAAALPIAPKANETIQHAREIGGFMIWPAESILSTQSAIIQSWWEVVRFCIEDVGTLQTFLTYACSLKARVDTAGRPNLVVEALALKTQSLARLRWRMCNLAPDLRTFAMIIHLFGAAFYALNLPVAMTHVRALHELTDALGGLMSLPQVHKELLLTSDVVLASVCLTKPLFDVEEWDPGSTETAAARMPGTSRSVTRLLAALSLCKQRDLPLDPSVADPRLRTMFDSLRELFHVEEYKAKITIAKGTIDDPIFRWLHLRNMACRSRLLRYYIETAKPLSIFEAQNPARRRDSITEDNSLPSLLSVAAIYAVTTLFGHPRLQSAHVRMSGLLRRTYLTCRQKLGEYTIISSHCDRAVLWCLAMGAIDEQIDLTRQNVDMWHSSTFARHAWHMGLVTLEEVRTYLNSFLYASRVYDKPLGAIFDNYESLVAEAARHETTG